MSTNEQGSPDIIGKLFIVRRHGLRECLVCGELFPRSTAPEHAIVDCYASLELLRLEPSQRRGN
jgi:hypothetical protein